MPKNFFCLKKALVLKVIMTCAKKGLAREIILSLVACIPIDTTSYSTLDLYSLLFIGLLQKTVQALMMMMKLRVGQKVICQQVKMKMRILQKMGYQYQLHRVMELTSSGIGYRRKCSRLPATNTLCSLYLQMDPK